MSQQFRLENAIEYTDVYSARRPDRLDVVADIYGPSMTREEFAEECDVNAIMARYEKTGIWPMQPNGVEPVYYDFTTTPHDLQSAMLTMIDAETAFMKLPALVRKEFDNDAMQFVEYASDPGNGQRMREWGLAEPEKVPDAPIRVEMVNPTQDNKPPADKAG